MLNKFDDKNENSYSEYIQKNIIHDDNYFFRYISYYYRQIEEAHSEFRTIIYDWTKNNTNLFLDITPIETNDKKLLTIDERWDIIIKKIELIKNVGEQIDAFEISGLFLMLNINNVLKTKED